MKFVEQVRKAEEQKQRDYVDFVDKKTLELFCEIKNKILKQASDIHTKEKRVYVQKIGYPKECFDTMAEMFRKQGFNVVEYEQIEISWE